MFMVDVQMALVVLCGVPVLAVFMFWIKIAEKGVAVPSNKNSKLKCVSAGKYCRIARFCVL